MTKFPEKLRTLVKHRVKNQSELAKKTGIRQTAISQMLLGKQRPYFDQAAKLAQALDVSLDYLAKDEMKTPPGAAERSQEEIVLWGMVERLGIGKAMDLLLRQDTGDKSSLSDVNHR